MSAIRGETGRHRERVIFRLIAIIWRFVRRYFNFWRVPRRCQPTWGAAAAARMGVSRLEVLNAIFERKMALL